MSARSPASHGSGGGGPGPRRSDAVEAAGSEDRSPQSGPPCSSGGRSPVAAPTLPRAAPRAAPGAHGGRAADEPAWKSFTPSSVDALKCMARTWSQGRGGQCTRDRRAGDLFCTCHGTGEKWTVHGRVDGPIPEAKLQEFQRTRLRRAASEALADAAPQKRKRPSMETEGSAKKVQVVEEAPCARAAVEEEKSGRPSVNSDAPLHRSGQQQAPCIRVVAEDEKCGRPSADLAAPLDRRPQQPQAKGHKVMEELLQKPGRQREEVRKQEGGEAPEGHSTAQGEERTAEDVQADGKDGAEEPARTPKERVEGARRRQEGSTMKHRMADERRRSKAKARLAGRQPRRAPDSAEEPHAAAKATPEAPPPKLPKAKPLKCTCGCPIHKERCRLFSPVYQKAWKAQGRQPASRAGKRPQRPVRPLPPPPRHLSAWASQQVTKMASEIACLPLEQRKAAWRQKMLLFHPDKRMAMDPAITGPSNEQATEVFVEIKRRYDHMVTEVACASTEGARAA